MEAFLNSSSGKLEARLFRIAESILTLLSKIAEFSFDSLYSSFISASEESRG